LAGEETVREGGVSKADTMAEVVLKNVTKVFSKDAPPAVKGFSLDIADREFVVFVGPSGCGKSTTLRMIAGLEQITSGDIYIGGTLVNDMHPKDRDIAMVFQNYALYPHMTVFENMAFALKLRKLPKEEIVQKVEKAADILGIRDLLNRKPKQLSGGQRQRVAIGRAIVREPKVFLMDEPLSNLDAKLRNQMRAEIIKLRGDVDTTFIYVTHDQTEAMTLGDRIVVMKDGMIMQVGTPREVFYMPKCTFVAGFIGTPQMNFFDAQLEKKEGGYIVHALGVDITPSAEVQQKLTEQNRASGEVTLGVRPEHLKIYFEPGEGRVSAKIDLTELMGSESFLHVNTSDAPAVIKVSSPQDLDTLTIDIKKDQKDVWFSIMPDRLQLFDNDTQQSLIYT